MNTRKILALAALLTLLLSGCSNFKKQQEPAVGFVTVVSRPYSFSIPTQKIDGAKIFSPLDVGITVWFAKDKYFQFDRFHNTEVDHKTLDMREYPKFFWGEKNNINLSAEQAEDFAGIKRIYESYDSFEAPIRLQSGLAYFAHNEKESMVLFTHDDIHDSLVRVIAENMTDTEIMELINSATTTFKRN